MCQEPRRILGHQWELVDYGSWAVRDGRIRYVFGYEAAAILPLGAAVAAVALTASPGIAAANPVEKHGDSGLVSFPLLALRTGGGHAAADSHYSHFPIAAIHPIVRTNPITRARIIRTPRTSPTRRISPRVRDRPPRRRRRPSHRVRRRRPPRTATTGITTSGHTTMRTRSRPPRPARARVHRRRPQRRAPSPR